MHMFKTSANVLYSAHFPLPPSSAPLFIYHFIINYFQLYEEPESLPFRNFRLQRFSQVLKAFAWLCSQMAAEHGSWISMQIVGKLLNGSKTVRTQCME